MRPTTRRTELDYPSRDGKPVAETPLHRDILLGLVETLKSHFAADPLVYVSGNMFVYYVPGDTRRRVAPDVWMARGVPDRDRDVFLVWEEPRGPEMVIEVTSKKTKTEDLRTKFELYRAVLKVREYFLFDPRAEHLTPPLQGYRLVEDQYVPIEPVAGRLPSEVAGLHLERNERVLRLHNPATGRWLPWTWELRRDAEAARQQAEAERHRVEAALRDLDEDRRQTQVAREHYEAARQQVEIALRALDEERRQTQVTREQLEAARQQIQAALRNLDEERRQTQIVREQLQTELRDLDEDRRQTQVVREQLQAALRDLDEERRQTQVAREQYEATRQEMAREVAQLRSELGNLRRRLPDET